MRNCEVRPAHAGRAAGALQASQRTRQNRLIRGRRFPAHASATGKTRLSGMAGPEYRRKAMAGRDNLSAGHRPGVRWQALTGHALVSRHPSGRQGRQGTLRRYIRAERQTARQKHDSPPASASASLKRAARESMHAKHAPAAQGLRRRCSRLHGATALQPPEHVLGEKLYLSSSAA